LPHHVPLIATIAVGLAVAFLLGFAAARLRMPPIIGYLLAGVAVGPFTPGFVADTGLAGQLAEIGVILLMFGVGMHFSLADLRAVRGIAIPGAIAQIVVATAMGATVAMLWDWPLVSGLVFGLALSVASTVVLLKALEQHGALDSVNGRIAVGWLVVEDIAMVLALVVLPAVAHSLGPEAGSAPVNWTLLARELGIALGKIVVFFVIIHYVGVRLFPWLFAQVAHTGSRELLTLFVIGVALGIAYGSAIAFDVSFALGAFFAGVVINESKLTSRIAAEAVPLENAFAVLFFVSVGMLFDPAVLFDRPLQVLAVILIVVAGKSFAALLIVLAFRYPLRTALTVSASLAQIGEFSFILAAMGVALGLLPQEGQSLILVGALLSITLNPLVFRTIDPMERLGLSLQPLAGWLERLARTDPDQTGSPPLGELRDHVVLVGYGRVGREIGGTLEKAHIPFVVIEQNAEFVERLRQQGVPAIRGDASTERVLDHAALPAARMLVAAVPDAFQARRMLQHARKVNPTIDSVVRTHSRAEFKLLQDAGFGLVLMAEQELADRMSGYVTAAFCPGPAE
jgi:CPA2 family monovalent cation:H+ antiporter-2